MADEGDAEAILNALRGRPRRLPWATYSGNGYRRVDRGAIASNEVARARGRALSRLKAAHPDEFERYYIDEQWKIAATDASA